MGTPPTGMLYGDKGELLVGPRRAATLLRWSFSIRQETLGPVRLHGTAHVDSVNGFLCTHPGFTLRLWMGKSWWVWTEARVIGQIVAGQTIDIRVEGTPEAERY